MEVDPQGRQVELREGGDKGDSPLDQALSFTGCHSRRNEHGLLTGQVCLEAPKALLDGRRRQLLVAPIQSKHTFVT